MGYEAPQTVELGLIDNSAIALPFTIESRHHAWQTWAEIAIEHEAIASGVELVEQTRPGLVAITSAAFALDAFYAVAEPLVPPRTLPKKGGEGAPRGGVVAEILKRGVTPGSITATWPARIKSLFKSRREAVHFGEKTAPVVMDPVDGYYVAPEVWQWRYDAAKEAVDLMLEVFEAWATHPSSYARSWAGDFGDAVFRLRQTRTG